MENKYLILKSNVAVTNYDQSCSFISEWAHQNRSCYIIAANVHVIMSAYWRSDYRRIVNEAALVTPDGMPLVFALHWLGFSQATRVYGPDLMLHCCQRAAQEKLSIYLYGSTAGVLSKLQETLQSSIPSLEIAGVHSPPFRPLTSQEELQDIERIHNSNADIVFVSLGCPKQEEWMARQQGKLNAVMIGVGAAFGFHSNTVRQAPRWMMASGLEWFYRLCVEPRRLWKRYLVNNPAFVYLFFLQISQHYLLRFKRTFLQDDANEA